MANLATGFGAALIALGVIGYLGTGSESLTALIPAAFGLLLLALGLMARDPARRKLAMHLAAGVGLLGFLGSVQGLTRWFRLISGETVARPNAVIAQAIMAMLTLVFLIFCIRSFVMARRNRMTA